MNPIRHPARLIGLLLTLAATQIVAQDSIPWVHDLNQARRLAEQQQRLVLLHFWSDNCMPCQHVEANVFNQPELIRVISTGFVPVKIHYQQQPKIAAFYKVDRFPTDIIVLPNGAEVYRTVSPSKANSYIAMLDQVRANAVANGLQQVQQVAQDASRSAQNLIGQLAPALPALPTQPGDLEPSYTVDQGSAYTQDSVDTAQDWRSNSPASQRQATTNEFVGPLDQKVAPRPATSGQRYGNPYLDQPMSPSPSSAGENRDQDPAGIASHSPNEQGGSWQSTRNETPAPPTGPTGGPNPNLTANHAGTAPPQGQLAQGQLAQGQLGQAAPQHSPPGTPGNASQATNSPGASTPGAPAAPAQPVLPPNSPPLALDGYCPVTLLESHKWEPGNPQFGAIHRGRTYLFRSQVERDRFLAAGAADHYAPVLSGLDPVRFVELQQSVEGNRAYGVVYQQHIYLFADEQALVQFEQQPERYVQVVRQAMAQARNVPPQR